MPPLRTRTSHTQTHTYTQALESSLLGKLQADVHICNSVPSELITTVDRLLNVAFTLIHTRTAATQQQVTRSEGFKGR